MRAAFYAFALGAVGVFVFVLAAWEGTRREARRLTRLTSRLAGLAAMVVLAQVVVRAARTAGGWSGIAGGLLSTLTGAYAAGTALRLVGAVLLMAGLVGLRSAVSKAALPIAGGAVDVSMPTVRVSAGRPPGLSTWRRVAAAPAAVVGALLLVASFAFVGHAATAASPIVARAAVLAHVTAAAVWGGGLLALVVVLWLRHRAGYRAGLIAARFSVVAAGGVALAAVAGVALAVVRLESVSALWATSYGLAVLAKVAVVGVVGAMGAYNHFIVVSALRSDPEHHSVRHLR